MLIKKISKLIICSTIIFSTCGCESSEIENNKEQKSISVTNIETSEAEEKLYDITDYSSSSTNQYNYYLTSLSGEKYAIKLPDSKKVLYTTDNQTFEVISAKTKDNKEFLVTFYVEDMVYSSRKPVTVDNFEQFIKEAHNKRQNALREVSNITKIDYFEDYRDKIYDDSESETITVDDQPAKKENGFIMSNGQKISKLVGYDVLFDKINAGIHITTISKEIDEETLNDIALGLISIMKKVKVGN